jgi:hypothetical protein
MHPSILMVPGGLVLLLFIHVRSQPSALRLQLSHTGGQALLLAPTEILAQQHHVVLTRLLAALPPETAAALAPADSSKPAGQATTTTTSLHLTPALLTGSTKVGACLRTPLDSVAVRLFCFAVCFDLASSLIWEHTSALRGWHPL